MCTWHPNPEAFEHDDLSFAESFHDLIVESPDDLSEIFIAITRILQERFDIERGLLVIREPQTTRFIATSTFSNRKVRKNLSLRIPKISSLFEKVAEQGDVFAESFCDLFSGNSFEKKLLMDNEAQSYILLPLKNDAEVVGMIGYSSETELAFTAMECQGMELLTSALAKRIGRTLTNKSD